MRDIRFIPVDKHAPEDFGDDFEPEELSDEELEEELEGFTVRKKKGFLGSEGLYSAG